jgi:hypothetical protein
MSCIVLVSGSSLYSMFGFVLLGFVIISFLFILVCNLFNDR